MLLEGVLFQGHAQQFSNFEQVVFHANTLATKDNLTLRRLPTSLHTHLLNIPTYLHTYICGLLTYPCYLLFHYQPTFSPRLHKHLHRLVFTLGDKHG
jgi:hypothetical protein